MGCQVEKGRDRSGSYFLGLKIRGQGDEDAPLFVTGLSDVTSNTKSGFSTVTDKVTDGVMDESTGGDRCDGCDGKTYNLLNVATKLAQIEQYTTVMEKELSEKDNLEENPSPSSQEQAQSTEGDELQENGYKAKEPASSVTNEDKGLKVGDRVRYVGKKYRESIGNQVMEVVKISVHWTGNQVTCSYDKGWTTWLTENSLKKVKPEKDHD